MQINPWCLEFLFFLIDGETHLWSCWLRLKRDKHDNKIECSQGKQRSVCHPSVIGGIVAVIADTWVFENADWSISWGVLMSLIWWQKCLAGGNINEVTFSLSIMQLLWILYLAMHTCWHSSVCTISFVTHGCHSLEEDNGLNCQWPNVCPLSFSSIQVQSGCVFTSLSFLYCHQHLQWDPTTCQQQHRCSIAAHWLLGVQVPISGPLFATHSPISI